MRKRKTKEKRNGRSRVYDGKPIMVYLSEAERTAVENASRSLNCSLSSYLRIAGLEKAAETVQRVKPARHAAATLARSVHEVPAKVTKGLRKA